MKIYRVLFGNRLRDALRKADRTQGDLAEHVRVEASTVSRWVNGHDFPSEKKFEKICGYLQLPQQYFIPVEPETEATDRILETLDALRAEVAELKAKKPLLTTEEYIGLWGDLSAAQRKVVMDTMRKLLGRSAAPERKDVSGR